MDLAPTSSADKRRLVDRLSMMVLAYVAFGALALSPLLWAAVPPLQDYPNHLARMSVLAAGSGSVQGLAYVPAWRFTPNLAMDLVVPPLAHVVPLETAGRLFLAAALTLIVGGTVWLHRTITGRAGLWPLVALLFLYDSPLSGGMVNFVFSLGLALVAFAGWLATRRWRLTVRLLLFAPVAVLLILCHLFGFGLYGLLVAAYELGELIADRPISVKKTAAKAASLIQFIPAAALWLAYRTNMSGLTSFGSFSRKLTMWFSPVTFNGYPTAFDKVLLAFAIGVLVVGFALHLFKLSSSMVLPIVAMVVVAFVIPDWTMGTWAADLRLPAALPFVVIAGTQVTISSSSQKLLAAVASAAAVVLLGVRIWAVSMSWHDMDGHFAEFRDAARGIPAGARIMVAQSAMPSSFEKFDGVPSALAYRRGSAFWHMPTLAVMDEGAFVTSLFAKFAPIAPIPRNQGMDRTHWQPLTADDLERRRTAAFANDPSYVPNQDDEVPCCIDWPHVYDFVVWIDYGSPPYPLPASLAPYKDGSFFHIYRIVRD